MGGMTGLELQDRLIERRTYSVAEYPALFELVERARTARRQAVELERPAPTRSAVVTPSAGAGG